MGKRVSVRKTDIRSPWRERERERETEREREIREERGGMREMADSGC